MPYARGPYAEFSSLPAEPRPVVGPSRKIDFARRTYVFDSDGAFEHMPSVAQRVALAVALAVPRGGSITPQEQERTRQAIAATVAPLAGLATNVQITVERTGPGTESRRVTYVDASTGLDETVQLA